VTRKKFGDANSAVHSVQYVVQFGMKVARYTTNVKGKHRKQCHVFVSNRISLLGYSIGANIGTARKLRDNRRNIASQGDTVEGAHTIKSSNVGVKALRANETNGGASLIGQLIARTSSDIYKLLRTLEWEA